MSRLKWVPRKQVQEYVFFDHRNEVSIVATVPMRMAKKLLVWVDIT
jgi:hypothetical protein